jgi:tripartite-type tricarboxylate transporter receptor subunit TctC
MNQGLSWGPDAYARTGTRFFRAASTAITGPLNRPGRIGRVLVCLFLMAAFCPAMAADAFPARPIDFIVPWGTGGGADYIGRPLAKLMAPTLGVSLPVINMPGATGQTGILKLKDSPADGYLIEEVTSETVLLLVTGRPHFELADFMCLGIVDQQPAGLLVPADSALATWQDVLRAGKVRTLSIAFDGFGSSGDLIVKYLAKKEGLKVQLVPFDKPGERIASILGKHNDLLFTQPGDVLSYINSKQLKPILLFADQRDGRFKDVPASKEFGYDASLVHFRAVFLKNGMEAQKVKLLREGLDKAVLSSEYQQILAGEYAIPNSYVPAAGASKYILDWLDQAKRIAGASSKK